MFEADMTEFQFVFSKIATNKTIMYFGFIYFLVMLFNTMTVSKYKLIDLLNAGKKVEQIKQKNLWLCFIVFVINYSTR
jgi:putative ABC transport system permease protein